MKTCEICGGLGSFEGTDNICPFVAVPMNLLQLQKALSNIIFAVVIPQIEGIVRGARNPVITMRP
jgi:hypothetical protein